ncbi:Mce protein [Mycobacterium hubeiense]|uniref:Mce protein n=1 Tax=Mycobacterium hubeiense TaxID=1867256 RepID=UPI0018ED3B80|nr:Mce protein [Mycobacterium sp. QGD 101]
MSKRTSTKSRDVFDRLAEQDEPVEVESAKPATESDDVEDSERETTPTDGESDDEADVESADGTEQAAPQPGRRRRRIVAGLLCVVFVAALGLSAFLGWRVKQLEATAAAGEAALEAARNYAVTLTTLDAKDIDKHYQQALDGATGVFKDEYSQGSAQLRQLLIDNKATGKGIVIDAAVKSATENKVEVLLFVDQSITNAILPSPRIDRNRVRMTMELIDNRWLASQVEIT